MSNRPTRRPSRSVAARQSADERSSNPLKWILLAAGVIIVVFGVAFAMGDPSASDFEAGVVEVGGEPLPTHAGTPQDPAVGQPAPEVTGFDVDGDEVAIVADGRPKVVLFLAHWCGHCQEEVPVIQDWIDENGLPDDVDVVAINTRFQTGINVWTPTEWLAEEGWTVPTMIDDADATGSTMLGLGGTPGYLVIDADGTVVVRASGQQSVEGFEALIEAARTGTA